MKREILLIVIGAVIGAICTWIPTYLILRSQTAAEKTKISTFISGCIQNDIDRIQIIVDYYKETDVGKLNESTFSWQHEAVLIQTITEQIGALDISIVKELNNYVIMINQSKAFRESLREALKGNNNNVKKVKFGAYISGLKAQIEVGKKVVNLINEK